MPRTDTPRTLTESPPRPTGRRRANPASSPAPGATTGRPATTPQSPVATEAGEAAVATPPATAAPAEAPRQAADAGRSIPTRRISFEEALAGLPKVFAGDGDIIASHFAAVLSALFPDGEDFFVRSVRHYRDQITDPALKRQVAGFIGQESIHGREHRALNDRLAELGYPTKVIERATRLLLETRERMTPAISNLAFTAALEHFTATLAEALLGDEGIRQMFGDPEARGLFMWHALEESEHKAVAFDVYRAVGGSELLRVWTMQGLRYGFTSALLATTAITVLLDGDTYRHGNLRRSLGHFFRSPLAKRAGDIWRRLGDYNRRDFHPDDHDTTELVAEWRRVLFGDEGTLNDKLKSTAA